MHDKPVRSATADTSLPVFGSGGKAKDGAVSLPGGYLWRRYNWGEPAWLLPEMKGWILYPAVDHGQLPQLPRWEGMESAFLGFAGYQAHPVSAAVYDLRRLLSHVFSKGLCRQHDPVGDGLSAADYVRYNLCGIWMGERTPFAYTPGPEYDAELGRFLSEQLSLSGLKSDAGQEA